MARAVKLCSVEACGKAAHNRDRFCAMHRARLRIHGDLDRERPTRFELVMAQVDASGDCWLWTGTKAHTGYGVFGHDAEGAHRVVYELLAGPIAQGLTLDHLCRVRACVNPDHLEPVTHAVNILRGVSPWALNARKTRCPQGHPYEGRNVYIERGSRMCRLCHNAKIARQRANRRRVAA